MCFSLPSVEVQEFRRSGARELLPAKPTFQVHESLLYPVISAQLLRNIQKQYEPQINPIL